MDLSFNIQLQISQHNILKSKKFELLCCTLIMINSSEQPSFSSSGNYLWGKEPGEIYLKNEGQESEKADKKMYIFQFNIKCDGRKGEHIRQVSHCKMFNSEFKALVPETAFLIWGLLWKLCLLFYYTGPQHQKWLLVGGTLPPIFC